MVMVNFMIIVMIVPKKALRGASVYLYNFMEVGGGEQNTILIMICDKP